MPFHLNAIWKRGAIEPGRDAVHVSMNDYLVHRFGDVPRVALAGLRLRSRWPRTEGALGIWVGAFRAGLRQVSVSIWRSPDDLGRFVRSPAHVQIMRDFKGAGLLYTTAWAAERFDPELIWRQALDRLGGKIDGVRHH